MANVPRSARGTSINPGAEHMMKLDVLRQKSSSSIPAASASEDTTKGSKPEMNFDDAQGDNEGDIDDGDKKRRIVRPDIADETTIVASVGYHEKVLAAADPDRTACRNCPPDRDGRSAHSRRCRF